jgi:hypothetical protein
METCTIEIQRPNTIQPKEAKQKLIKNALPLLLNIKVMTENTTAIEKITNTTIQRLCKFHTCKLIKEQRKHTSNMKLFCKGDIQ